MPEQQPGVRALHDDEPPMDAISHQACTWFALFADGAVTPEQREAWQLWILSDKRHAEAYAELERLWQMSAGLQAPVSRPVLSRRRLVQFATAASAVALVGGSTLWLSGTRVQLADRSTSVGERRSERLPDGTLIELAGDSAFDFDVSGAQRWVRMRRGEAFFQVAADAKRPLRVDVAGGVLSTAGAEFCLACNGDRVDVSVSQQALALNVASQQAELHAGQMLDFTAKGLGTIRPAALDQAMAWRTGRLVFFDTPLATVASSLERWRRGRIFIADEQLAKRPVSLIVNLQQPEHILDVLAQALPIRVSRYTPWVTVIQAA